MILIVITSYGLGALALRRARFTRAAERFVFSSALGMAILSTVVLILGALGWMSQLAVAVIFAALCAASVVPSVRFAGGLAPRRARLDFLSAVCLAVLLGAAALNLAVTINPILEVDAYEYHITVPKAWLVAGRIFAIPYCFQANYHFLAEMLNVIALSLSANDVVLCKLIQWYCGILLAMATWSLARSFFSARVAWVAATLTYLVKEISWISASAYIDLTVGLYVWLGIFALLRAAHLRNLGYHALAGLYLGCAFAAKQTGLMFLAMAYVAYGVVLLLDRARRGQLAHLPGQAVLAAGLALMVASPWMVKNYAFTGDPFFPFLTKPFGVGHEYAQPARCFLDYYGGLGRYLVWNSETLPRLVRAFVNFRTNVLYSGANMLVVWLLVSILVAVICRCRTTFAWRLLVAIGLVAAPLFALVTSRFLFGFFPAYTVVLVETLRRATWRRRRLFTLLALVLVFFYARTFVTYNFHRRYAKRIELTGGLYLTERSRKQWLRGNNPSFAVVQRINRTLGPSERLLVCSGFQAAPWIDVPFLPNPHSYSRNLLLLLWDRFGNRERMCEWLDGERITHILIDNLAARELEQKSGFVGEYLEPVFKESSLTLFQLRRPGTRNQSD